KYVARAQARRRRPRRRAAPAQVRAGAFAEAQVRAAAFAAQGLAPEETVERARQQSGGTSEQSPGQGATHGRRGVPARATDEVAYRVPGRHEGAGGSRSKEHVSRGRERAAHRAQEGHVVFFPFTYKGGRTRPFVADKMRGTAVCWNRSLIP